MKFDKHFPSELLKPYIKYLVVSENEFENEYKGQFSTIKNSAESKLNSAGITGISNGYKIFKNSDDIGTLLVYFTETGFTHFASHPANTLFNLSLTLEDIFDKNSVSEVEEKLAIAATDKDRINIVEQFLISQLKGIETDKLVVEAVKLIYQSKGTIRIKDLNERLFISQSPFEKRFRKVVGTTAKKFASIVRFNTVLENLNHTKTLTEICFEHNFFDQAHFIKDFKQFTGDTPENFKRFL